MTFAQPAYGVASLADVLPSVGRAVGVDIGPAPIELPPAPAYVVMLVDGMGADLIRSHPAQTPFLSTLPDSLGTACVPSTTVTSLTSLGTGLPPGAHGLVGFTSRIPGTSKVMQALRWDDSVDPLRYQPHETAFDRLERAGVATTVVSKSDFAESGLTRCAQRGARYRGADDLTARIEAAVSAAGSTPSVTYVYDSDLDFTGHVHGVDSSHWRQALDDADAACEQLREALPSAVRMLVLADHGMIDAGERIDLDDMPALRAGVSLVAGEARFRHLYCPPAAVPDVVATWSEVLGPRAVVLTREEAIQRGWFGPVESQVLTRLGDVVVACTGDFAILSSKHFRMESKLIGMHGSLTPAEMSIPLLVG